VNAAVSGGMLQKAVRAIKDAKGNHFTEILKASDGVGTAPVEASYYAFCNYAVEADLRAITGFKTVSEYPNGKGIHPNEFGKYQNIRFFTSPELAPFLDAGAAIGVLNLKGTTAVDVYPIIIVAKDAVHSISLEGSGKEGYGNLDGSLISGRDKNDLHNQRTFMAFDFFDCVKITNEAWIARLEVGATRDLA
jgi:N4-gp56 family major capsid protein